MLTGTNLKHARAFNFRIVLETVRLYGPISRADIARRTGLTAQTISNITREALQTGLVVEGEQVREGRGAPSTALTANPDGAFSIGLDLDKDHLTGVLMDFGGSVRQRRHLELRFPPPEQAFDLMEGMVLDMLAAEPMAEGRVWGVGIGFPGPLDVRRERITNTVNPTAFPGWHNIPVVGELTRRLSLPIFLENNATAAAVGERWFGAGQHIDTFFYLYFTAGLGGGMIIKGQPYEGYTGNAGEIGYMPATGEEDPSAMLGRPHIGQYFNLPRLYRRLEAAGYPIAEPDDLLPLFKHGNELLNAWLDEAATYLAPVVLSIAYIIDPQAIFFGGRLPEAIIRELMDRLNTRLPDLRLEGTPPLPAFLMATAGLDGAALGVATLPMYASFSPVPRVLMKRRSTAADPALLLTPDLARAD